MTGVLASMSTSAETIMRHPSEEDLNAAHQLVSSAGGRRDYGNDLGPDMQENKDGDWEAINGSDTGGKMDGLEESPSKIQRGPADAASSNRVPSSRQSPKSPSKEPIFLGHSCR